MRKYQKKTGFKRYMETWPAIIAVFALVLIVGWGVVGLAGGLHQTIKNKNIASANLTELKERQARLEYDIENLETIEGKEKIFRENYGLAKEGEGLIVIVEDKDANKDKEKKKGVFGVFKNIFKRD